MRKWKTHKRRRKAHLVSTWGQAKCGATEWMWEWKDEGGADRKGYCKKCQSRA